MKLMMFDSIYTIQIGQNQNENDSLLKSAEHNHTWFHLSDYPSPHLVINVDYNLLSKEQIYRIACILKKNTKYRKENYISIDYTLRSNIELTNEIGKVLLHRKYKTICV